MQQQEMIWGVRMLAYHRSVSCHPVNYTDMCKALDIFYIVALLTEGFELILI